MEIIGATVLAICLWFAQRSKPQPKPEAVEEKYDYVFYITKKKNETPPKDRS
jgi:hypothetical protein